MENRTVRLIVAFIAALIGAFLLYVTGNPDSTPGAAFWSLFLGLEWLQTGLGKFANPAWSTSGEALRGL
jgi:hypothetical protein